MGGGGQAVGGGSRPLTFAGVFVGGHGVALGGTGTLVAPRDVDTLKRTHVPDALGALINVYRRTHIHTHTHTHTRTRTRTHTQAHTHTGSVVVC